MKHTTFLSSAMIAILATLMAVSCNKPLTPEQQQLLKAHALPRTEIEKLKAAAAQEAKDLKKGQTNLDLAATVKLAKLYENGSDDHGVVMDFYLSGLLYKRAATNGNTFAQNRIGRMYELGHTTFTRNYTRSAYWYRMAADRGYRDAESNLGFLYEKGRGVPQDYVVAGEWYLKAAEKGEPFAQYRLGLLFELGKGVPRNDPEAAKWILMAAEGGLPEAQFKMANMYYEGQGVKKDVIEALRWFERAARQGYVKAQTQVGLLYMSGNGVEKDDVEAYKWLNIAASKDDTEAQTYRDIAAREMTQEKVRFAQDRASEFKPEVLEIDAARLVEEIE